MKHQHFRQKTHSNFSLSSSDQLLIYGIHAVTEALLNPNRSCIRLFASERLLEKIEALCNKRNLPITLATPSDIDQRLGYKAVHQGVLLEVLPLPDLPFEKLGDRAPIIVLDQITDPRNAGSILRSAAAFGAAAVIRQEKHAPPPEGVLAKAAAGALEHVPYLEVTNISRTLDWFKQHDRWIIGLDSNADSTIDAAPANTPLVLVLGAEGSGLRRLTKKHCDLLLRIDLPGSIKSLNVSNAAAIALHAMREK